MNNNNFVLYMHLAPNNKKYFGITGKKKPEYRWGKDGCGYNSNDHFTKAIAKHGWSNIKHIVLADKLTKEEACFFEQVMIALYNTTNPNNGYNNSLGGEHGKHSEETKRKLSEINKGKKLSEETKRKMSISRKGLLSGENNPNYGKCGENSPNYGRRRTEEARRKMSENHADVNGKNNPSARSVICLSTKRVFFTAVEGGRYYNVDNSTINKCCKGKNKSCGKLPDGTKLTWRYLNYKHNKTYHIAGGYLVDNEKMARLIEESFGQTLGDEEIALLIEDIFGTDESIDYDNLPDII